MNLRKNLLNLGVILSEMDYEIIGLTFAFMALLLVAFWSYSEPGAIGFVGLAPGGVTFEKVAVFEKSAAYGIEGKARILGPDRIRLERFSYSAKFDNVSINLVSRRGEKFMLMELDSQNFYLTTLEKKVSENILLDEIASIEIFCDSCNSNLSTGVFK